MVIVSLLYQVSLDVSSCLFSSRLFTILALPDVGRGGGGIVRPRALGLTGIRSMPGPSPGYDILVFLDLKH